MTIYYKLKKQTLYEFSPIYYAKSVPNIKIINLRESGNYKLIKAYPDEY